MLCGDGCTERTIRKNELTRHNVETVVPQSATEGKRTLRKVQQPDKEPESIQGSIIGDGATD